MVILAVVIMVLCAVFALGIVIGSSGNVELGFFTFKTDSTPNSVFFVGLVTGAVFMIGVWLLIQALRHERNKAVERKEMEHRRDALEKEKAELEKKLDAGRTSTAQPAPAPRFQPPAGSGGSSSAK